METVSKVNAIIEKINSLDCFEILKKNFQSHLIDVRCQPEWEFVGIPDLKSINKKTILICLLLFIKILLN